MRRNKTLREKLYMFLSNYKHKDSPSYKKSDSELLDDAKEIIEEVTELIDSEILVKSKNYKNLVI